MALDRHYVSQYAQEILGLQIHVQGEIADPDGSAVTVSMEDSNTGAPVLSRAATRTEVGRYEVTLQSNETQVTGDFTVRWSFSIGGVARTEVTHITIGAADPAYDDLSPNMKMIVEQTWGRFEDTFDSPMGGPNLQTYFQTSFGRGRLAKLLRIAVGRLNTAAQPFQTYTLDGEGGAVFPVDKWGPLLEQALYIEALKHLVRSYVEQPSLVGGSVTTLDRRDYMDRWERVLQEEQAEFKKQLDSFKISGMNLGRPAVLVSGGVYGRWGPTRMIGNMAARPRLWARFYIAVTLVGSLGACLGLQSSTDPSLQPTYSIASSGHTSTGQGA